jgi:hypothetical protein
MKRKYDGARLTSAEWGFFEMRFGGDVDAVVNRAMLRVNSEIDRRMGVGAAVANATKPDAASPLPQLRAARDAAKAAVGVDAEKAKRFSDLRAQVAAWESERKALEVRIAHVSAAPDRRKVHTQIRREAYQGVFDSFEMEQKVLEGLYEPLVQRLKQIEAAAKLEFTVTRRVDVDAWVRRGEDLLDLSPVRP